MSRLSPSFDSQSEQLGSITASLFYQLAHLLIWGKEHPEVVATYPDFADLLQSAGSALMKGGILDQQNGLSAEALKADSQGSTSALIFRPEGRA